ncbi:MAG: hypothetical protein GY851_28395 [bacterium]|nr:hypothetical protein [bacterium]
MANLLFVACMTMAAAGNVADDFAVACPGAYGGHLQGVAVEPGKAIYWSFTVEIVKTDLSGNILNQVKAPSHQGDLTYHDGKVYVAVNLGQFNQEPGKADSWIYVYDAKDLTLLSKKPAPELVHGAGGMAYHDKRFIVVGGLPKTHNQNYAYEYDKDLTFVKRHVIESGQTNLGIQTAEFFDGHWWFGCYEERKGLLKCDEAFNLAGRYEPNYSVGIARLDDKQLLLGTSKRDPETKQYDGKLVVKKPKCVDGEEAKREGS